jgi:hypothetical protein
MTPTWELRVTIEADTLTEALAVSANLPRDFLPESLKDERIIGYSLMGVRDGRAHGLAFGRLPAADDAGRPEKDPQGLTQSFEGGRG